jgi:hypothetical protein
LRSFDYEDDSITIERSQAQANTPKGAIPETGDTPTGVLTFIGAAERAS